MEGRGGGSRGSRGSPPFLSRLHRLVPLLILSIVQFGASLIFNSEPPHLEIISGSAPGLGT